MFSFWTFLSLVTTIFCQNIPVPTDPQLAYQHDEIVGLTHFNMATYLGGGNSGCNSNTWTNKGSKPTTFSPTTLNVSNWLQSYQAVGAKAAILTAKHGCGFLLWPTKTIIPSTNTLYNYSIQFTSSPLNTRDIAKEFANTLSAAGIGHGYYYSLATNFYLNVKQVYVQNTTLLPGQIKVTQTQFQQIATNQLTELFSNYGNLTEFWFDGGTGNQVMAQAVTNIISKYQPNMAVFNGQHVSKNMIKWVGTESGGTSKPIWSLGESNTGDPNSNQFCPTCCDTTLQNGDEWFYDSRQSIRTLSELITVYHNTVGNNCVLELDFAVDTTGNIASNQAQRYKEFGDWIYNCYGNALYTINGTITNQNGSLKIGVNGKDVFDRFMIKENISQGQRVRKFSILIDGKNVYSSTSVGNKRIVVLSKVYSSVQTVEFVAEQFVGSEAYIAQFSVFANCSS
eukprot:301291_1